MFQSKMLFEAYSYNSGVGERDPCIRRKTPNLLLLAEGEGATATSLGQRPSRGGIIIILSPKIIHRVPSVEGATATSLGNLLVTDGCKEINRKNAPNELFLVSKQKNQGR